MELTRWRLRCMECGREWVLPVSFDLSSMGRIYHYCPYCKRNTFHVVLGRIEEWRIEESEPGDEAEASADEEQAS